MSQSRRMYTTNPDIMTSTLTVKGREPGVSVPAEEVIRFFGSGGLKPRTCDRVLDYVSGGHEEEVTTLQVLLRPGNWTGFEQLDVMDALGRFEARKEALSCA